MNIEYIPWTKEEEVKAKENSKYLANDLYKWMYAAYLEEGFSIDDLFSKVPFLHRRHEAESIIENMHENGWLIKISFDTYIFDEGRLNSLEH